MNFKLNLRYVRYFLFFLTFLIFSFAIQVFVQNFNMNSMINDSKQEQLQLSWQTFWMKHYYEPFLKSEYSKFISQHKYWIVTEEEILVKFEEEKTFQNIIEKPTLEYKNYNNRPSNEQLRKDFFQDFLRFEFLK